ncbi:peptidoglycan DD-metalloendopeptidase family protein [Finegoldia magna]|uniref:murein hydrolase activator EnvC family protein n=1 Tax=Finegoldia magna TaxID=1260 RepID=UPI0029054937|nr:peptidoglycan DD-metalloendopeptidase family protein [Finegoldia magna]MDU1213040.1 peptidoglycan DD-metalloendopeptidase family protein [Finegoldia magna]
MKKKIVALALCMMLMTNAVYADKLTELNNEKKSKTSDLNESKSNLNKLKDNKDAEMEKLKNINLKLTQTQSELAIQQQELEKINKSIDDTKKEIEKYQSSINKKTKEFQKRLKGMYISKDGAKVDVIFGSGNLNDLLNNVSLMNYIARYDKNLLNDLKHEKISLDYKKDELKSKMQTMEIVKKNLELKVVALNDTLAEQQKLIDDISKNVSMTESEISSLIKELEKIDGKIDQEKKAILQAKLLAAQRAQAEKRRREMLQRNKAFNTNISAPVVNNNGAYLQWPVPSSHRMTSFYGWRSDPFGRGSGFHTGLDIAAPLGTHIVSAEDGVVVHVGWSGGYGNLVKVQHDNGALTYYGHLSGYNCSVGQRVKRGQLIAYIGSTGYSTGPHLHFEVRFNGQHTDPLNYLR